VLLLLSWGIVVGAGPTSVRAQEQPQARPAPDTSLSDTSRVDSLRQKIDKRQGRPLSLPSTDSLAVDRLAGGAHRPTSSPDTGLVERYLPSSPRRSSGLFESYSPFLGPRTPTTSAQPISLDTSGTHYTIGASPHTDGPMRLDPAVYRRANYRANLQQNWATLVEQRQQRSQRSGLGVSMQVPGGGESAFTTVFGKPQVDLRVNGKADINAGFKYSKNDEQGARTGDATQLDPSFKQNLRLGITGTIGDKLKINVDWDTESQFDYQNQVKLEYTGYQDEIIQKVEAGNVFLETPSQLISGGQSLFGIKSKFQLGNLTLTTIASQQEGQSNSLSIKGGAETSEFDLKPTDYDDDKHFFLGYYFRNTWNIAHTANPSTISTSPDFGAIEKIEVWKLETSQSRSEDKERQKVAALVDLGEPPVLLQQADEYTAPVLPDPQRDQYTESNLNALRDGDTTVSGYVGSNANLDQPLQSQDFENGTFKKLEKGRDYRLDTDLGFLSLNQRLRSNEALALAFQYRTGGGGEVRQIGDFSADQGGTSGGVTADRLVLKLLRPSNPVAPGTDTSEVPPVWFLEMKNIYQLGGRELNANNFNLDVEYSPAGQGTQTSLPSIAGQQSLLQTLGLDLIDQNGTRNPDNEFDFIDGVTIDGEKGLLYFRYLQPFGERIFAVADSNGNRSEATSFAFPELYLKKKSNAQQENQEKNVYRITGSYKGQAKGFYDLEAFTGLVDGSVKVTSGGQTLKEGTDYVVDYQSGTVNITNQSYLSDGREINIDYEQQSIANLQKKTLVGARADWAMQDQFALGATVMRLSQQSPVDKYRIGEEPIRNTIWGVDGSMDLEPRWLTEAVDALPLIQTRAESSISISGEFAQLRPGHTRTEAFEQTLDSVQTSNKESYAPDERNGVSYIEDFEGFENTFSLREQLNAWQVSAAPDSIAPGPNLNGDEPGNEDDLARSYWRGNFAWYRLTRQIKDDLEGKVPTSNNPEATELLNVREVFPERDTRGASDQTLRTLDLYFNPWQRGPYNYTDDLAGFFRNPERVWGGITRRMPEGYVDFSRQNVEFVELIVKVYPENGQITDGSKLYVNLGTISEDVVPNEEPNTENGLSFNFNRDDFDADLLSRLASSTSERNTIEVRNQKTEDLGLDGLVSYTDGGPYAEGLREQNFYSDLVAQADSLDDAIGGLGLSSAQQARLEAEVARLRDDPSADDYHHYDNNRYFNDDAFFAETPTLQQRFSRYYAGYELNGFEPQDQLAENVSLRRGITGNPDSEDLDGAGRTVNFNDSYYQYAIPLDSLDIRAETDAGPTDYVVSRAGRKGSNWYKVRIPVRTFTKRVGNIQDFTSIESVRLWTQGHAAPITMRLASIELVGSQWRKSPSIAEQPVERGDIMDVGDGELRVASINNEEDPGYDPPVGAVVSRNRTSRGAQQNQKEQSLLLNVNELDPGQQRGVFKTYQQGLDLLKYSNLRMYTHVHGASNSPQVKEKIRKNLRLFVRLGSNETSDYYEYEQPLTPSNGPGQGGGFPWLEENEMNLVLSALSQLKTARTQFGFATDSTFTSDQVDISLDFAPEGTRLKIRGTPSLNQVNTVVIGVRHVGDPMSAPPLRNVELWTNELRVSGFDERKGWATNSNANISLADLATLQGSFQRKTDGFGALSSTLGERKQSDNTSWSARAEVKLGSLFPKRQGWSIPVTMQVQSSRTEPRFAPQRGDVRVQEVQDQFDVLPDSTIERQFGDQYSDQSVSQIRQTLKDSVRRASQTTSLQQTVTANLSKSGSDAWWMQKTIDATSLNFSYLNRAARSPQLVVDEKWSWSGSFDYQLDFGQARTVRPLGFLPDVPVLGALSEIQFNYVPTSLSFSGSADRGFSTKRNRPSPLQATTAGGNDRPLRITKPFRDNQNFTHNRTFSLQYEPFNFLSLGFDTNVQQTLNDVASRTRQNLFFTDTSPLGGRTITDVDTSAFLDNPPRSVRDRLPADTTLRDLLGSSLFVEERLRAKPEGEVLRDLFFGDASPRTNTYQQRFSSTLSLGITDRKALDWIDLQDVSYQASFNWNNGAKDSRQGASVQNSVTLRTGVTLKPNKVWERFEFFGDMKEAQRTDNQGSDDASRQDRPSGNEQTGTDQGEEEGDASGENGESETADEAEGEPSWEDVPLPDPVNLLRGLALTFMDIRDFTINYNGERAAQSSNVGTGVQDSDGNLVGANTSYSLTDAVQGNGPSIGYRFGLSRSIDPETNRVFPPGQNVRDNLTNNHRFEARTALTPSSSLNIDLNWNVSWSTQPEIEFRRPDPDSSIQRIERESGSASASIWAFGSYESFFKAQLDRLQRNVDSPNRTWEEREVALTEPSVAEAFRNTYLTGGTSIAANGFVPLPLPGWTVRYSGLSDWPLIKRVTESVSLNHGYNASYETSFSSNSTAGEENSVTVTGQQFAYIESDFRPESPNIQEQFQPLIGMDITWPWNLETSFQWNRTTTTALRGVDAVREKKTEELSGSVSFSKRGLTLPFLSRIENRIRLSVNFSRSVSNERTYNLTPALEQAQSADFNYDPKEALQGDNVNLKKTTRITVSPEVSYSVSDRVTADFRLNYERFSGRNTGQSSYTNVDGTFNLSVSISEN